MALAAIHSYKHSSIHSFKQQLNISYKQCILMVNKIQRYLALKKITFLEEHIAIISYNLLTL